MWVYQGKPFTEDQIFDNIGFVYIITNTTNNRKYIGRKLFVFKKTKIVKGKRKSITVQSNWKSYFGSNDELLQDIEKLGQDNFTREIIALGRTKGVCSYFEAKLQFDVDCLRKHQYYNSWIMCRIHTKHIKDINCEQAI